MACSQVVGGAEIGYEPQETEVQTDDIVEEDNDAEQIEEDTIQAENGTEEETTLELNTNSVILNDSKSKSAVVIVTDTTTPTEEGKSFTFKSKDESVAKVEKYASDSFKVTAVNYGTTTVEVTSADGKKTATCTVNVSCTDFTVEDMTICLGDDPVKITPKFKEGFSLSLNKMTFESDLDFVAQVTENREIKPISAGEANITLTLYSEANFGGPKVTKTFKVTVNSPVTGINVSKDKLDLNIGKTYQLNPIVLPAEATDSSVKYISSDNTVAKVSADGLISAVSEGTATITIAAKDGSKVTKDVKVTVTQPVEEMIFERTDYDLFLGWGITIPAPTIKPSNATNKEISFSSTDENVITVDEEGNVTTVGTGTASVIARAKDGSNKTVSILFNVKGQIAAISTNKDKVQTEEGKEDYVGFKVTVSGNDAYPEILTAKASDETVVGSLAIEKGVDATDSSANTLLKFKALKAGETDIIVSSKNPTEKNVSITIHVTVTQPAPQQQEVVVTPQIDVKNVTYKISNEDSQTATVTKIEDVKGNVTIQSKITIGDKSYKVTEIADKAFQNKKKITSVTIPSSVTVVGKAAFKNCTKLKTVKIGSNVSQIKDEAFAGCPSLTKVTIPARVTKIGKKAFYNCKKLKTVTIKTQKLKSVGASAFKGIAKNSTIKVPKKKLTAYKKLFKGKYTTKNTKIK